jgi:hypothetical protein
MRERSQMANVGIRRYFLSVYRLAQQAAEALALFGVIQTWFKTGAWAKDFDNAVANEELFRIIASGCRRTSIITIHILCDNRRPGTCNIFGLVKRIGLSHSEKRAIRQRLKSIAGTVSKIGTLRNHFDAHLSEDDEWKKGLGDGLKRREVNRVLVTVFSVLIECGKALGIPKLGYEAICSANELYGERLIRALSEQVAAGKTGRQIMSVRDWEDQREWQDEPEPE